MNIRVLISIAALGCLTTACVSQQVIKVNDTPAIQAQENIPEHQLLDVGIALFDPGIPEDFEEMMEQSIVPEVREAESRYLPYTLRTTLQNTGQWGAVRVIPRASNAVEVTITGKILVSDGEQLTLNIKAQDASGRIWLDKDYSDIASKYSYTETGPNGELDPFQDLFNNIANDVLAAREQLSEGEIAMIRNVAELRFATDLSPYAFDEHLQITEAGTYEINRLPASDDPMMVRMYQIREREYMFIDTLDQTYASFHQQMDDPYEEWRKFSYEEAIALRELEEAAFRRKVLGTAAIIAGAAGAATARGSAIDIASNVILYGGISLFKAGVDAKKESRMHAEAMRELADSFAVEVEPLVLDVEGETVTLTGTAEEQYEEWRRLLRQIYQTETGLTVAEEDIEDDAGSGPAAGF